MAVGDRKRASEAQGEPLVIEAVTEDGHTVYLKGISFIDPVTGEPVSMLPSSTAAWDGTAVDLSGFEEAQIDAAISSGNVQVDSSIDGVTWHGAYGKNMSSGAEVVSGAIAASGLYTFPASGFIRATPSVSATLNLLRR